MFCKDAAPAGFADRPRVLRFPQQTVVKVVESLRPGRQMARLLLSPLMWFGAISLPTQKADKRARTGWCATRSSWRFPAPHHKPVKVSATMESHPSV